MWLLTNDHLKNHVSKNYSFAQETSSEMRTRVNQVAKQHSSAVFDRRTPRGDEWLTS
eukprot:m.600191 g.600191  ORF g.600191 m.600191 type:complete len:57 (+) comp22429_c0_seq7:1736-1906(+)